MSLPRFAMRRPVTMGMAVVAVVVAGSISAGLISLDLMPPYERPVIRVTAPYADANPQEVERRIIRPMEEALGTVRHLESMSSTASQDQGRVELEFEPGTNMDHAALEVRERVEVVQRELPAGVERVRLRRFSTDDQPVVRGTISWDGDGDRLSHIVERQVEPAILQVEGVAGVEFSGIREREVLVDLDQDRMRSAGVGMQEVSRAVNRGNLNLAAGELELEGWRYLVRSEGQVSDVDEIRNLPLDGDGLLLRDVADIRHDHPERESFFRHNGEESRMVEVYKEAEANVVDVARAVRAELEAIQAQPGLQGMEFHFWQDQSEIILEVLTLLGQAGAIGGILAVLVLLTFLRRFTPTLIVAAAIPVSLVFAVAILYAFGRTLNVVTLSGLMLAVGMLIDNAVVVVENIFRHRELGSEPREASVEGASEVGLAIFSGTLTTVIVFTPLFFVAPSQMGVQLEAFGISISTAMLASLGVAFTLVPLLAIRFMAGRIPPPGRLFAWFRERYRGLLERALDRRLTVAGLALLLFVAGGWILADLPRELEPEQDHRFLMVTVSTPPFWSVEQRGDVFERAESRILERADDLEIETVSAFSFGNRGRLMLTLVPFSEGGERPTAVVSEELESILPVVPGVEWSQRRGFGGPGGGQRVTVRLRGESTQELGRLADEVRGLLEANVTGIRNVDHSLEAGNEEVRVRIDRDAAEREGVTSRHVAQEIASGLRGEASTRFRTGEREVDVVLQLRDRDQVSVNRLGNLAVSRGEGRESVPLGALADHQVVSGPDDIQRQDRRTTVTVSGEVAHDAHREEVVEEVQGVMAGASLPHGYEWDLGRQWQEEQEQFAEMLLAALLALVLIYLILAALFESLLLPFIIYLSIFFAVPGLGLVFFLTGGSLSILSFLGILITIGIVVNNSIVMIDLVNQYRRRGMDRREAVLTGCQARFRPVLMTSVTTLIGLVPMAFMGGGGELGSIFQPIGQAVIGGLATSTLLTLTLTPTLYTWLDDLGLWGARTYRQAVSLAGARGEPSAPASAAGD